MKCPCCGPAPGKKRKYYMRKWKRMERAQANKEIQKELTQQDC